MSKTRTSAARRLVPRSVTLLLHSATSQVKPPHHVKVAWHRGGPSHTSVTERGDSNGAATSHGVPSPPHGAAGPPAPPMRSCMGDMAPPLGNIRDGLPANTGPTRRTPWTTSQNCDGNTRKHGADAEVCIDFKPTQLCAGMHKVPFHQIHTAQRGYLVQGGGLIPPDRTRPPCGLRLWWLPVASKAATVQRRRHVAEPQHER